MSPIENFINDGYTPILVKGLPLNADSKVVVVGGYLGHSTEMLVEYFNPEIMVIEPVPQYVYELNQRFSQNKKVRVIPVACASVAGRISISVDGERSGSFYGETDLITVEAKTLSEILADGDTDLVEMNIEGGEYQVLPELIRSGKINSIKYLNIQFHVLSSDSDFERAHIRKGLMATHIQTFSYDWVWEQWTRKMDHVCP